MGRGRRGVSGRGSGRCKAADTVAAVAVAVTVAVAVAVAVVVAVVGAACQRRGRAGRMRGESAAWLVVVLRANAEGEPPRARLLSGRRVGGGTARLRRRAVRVTLRGWRRSAARVRR